MSDDNQNNAPDPNQNGGAGNDDGEGAGEKKPPEPTPIQVSPEAYEAMKKDMLRFKGELRETQAEAKRLREEKLTNEKNWEELAKTREQERDEAIQKSRDLESSVLNSKKYDAVKNECVKLGIKTEALEDLKLLDLNEVQTELTTLGNVNVHGHTAFAERLKTLRPHWFGPKNPPNLNTNTPGIVPPTGTVTPQELAAAEREGKKKGDMSAYRALFSKYLEQQRSAG